MFASKNNGDRKEQKVRIRHAIFRPRQRRKRWVSRKPRAQQTRPLLSHSLTSNHKLLRLALLSRFHVSACWLVVRSSSSAPACGFSTAQRNPCWAPGHEKGVWRLVELPRFARLRGCTRSGYGLLGASEGQKGMAWHGHVMRDLARLEEGGHVKMPSILSLLLANMTAMIRR